MTEKVDEMKQIDVNKEDVLKIGVEMLTSGSVKNLTLKRAIQ